MEWISVKDRLPEGDDTVIVYCGRGYGLAKYTSLTSMWHIQLFLDEWYKARGCVTHWMPLPEPPQEDIGEWAACARKEESTIHITMNFSPDEKITVRKLMEISEKVIREAFVDG